MKINKLLLLELLEKDGRISFAELARKLNVTETAVRKTYAKLVDDGAIVKITAVVDYAVLETVEHPKKLELWAKELNEGDDGGGD